MSSDSGAKSRQHASTGPSLPQPLEPSHAERVRTLLALVKTGTLSTLSRKHPGFPFGSLMPYAVDSQGRAIFLIRNMSPAIKLLEMNRSTFCLARELAR